MYAMVHVPGGTLKTPPPPLLVPLVIMTKMTAPLMMTLTMTQRNIMREGGSIQPRIMFPLPCWSAPSGSAPMAHMPLGSANTRDGINAPAAH